jgi:hypothetical protein
MAVSIAFSYDATALSLKETDVPKRNVAKYRSDEGEAGKRR